MTHIDDATLEIVDALAMAATPGPWIADGCRIESEADAPPPRGGGFPQPAMTIYDEGGHNKHDAAYIAAVSPDVWLAASAEIRDLRAEIARLRERAVFQLVHADGSMVSEGDG